MSENVKLDTWLWANAGATIQRQQAAAFESTEKPGASQPKPGVFHQVQAH